MRVIVEFTAEAKAELLALLEARSPSWRRSCTAKR
jgi:hypothetical protein